MSSIDHLPSDTKMLQIDDHLNLLAAQYLVQCLDTENVCHQDDVSSTKGNEADNFTRHNQIVLPLLVNNRRHTIHTTFVNTAIDLTCRITDNLK